MTRGAWAIAYLAALLAITLLDGLWLLGLARGFYQREMGELMRPQVVLLPALLFYLGYPAGLVALALVPQTGLAAAAWRGALVGLVAYGVYDLTNLATLRGWSGLLSGVDLLWGCLLSAAGAGAGAWAAARFAPPR